MPGLEKLNIVFYMLKLFAIILFLMKVSSVYVYKNSMPIVFIFLYGLAISISNLFHGGSILALRSALFFPALFLICSYFIRKRALWFLDGACLLFGVYNALQLITVILFFPHGITHYSGEFWKQTLAGAIYFFGAKNQAVMYILTFLFTWSVRNWVHTQKISIKIIAVSLIFMAEVYILDSASSIVCIALFIFFYIICTSRIEKHFSILFNPYLYYCVVAALLVLICVLSKAESFTFIGKFLSLLGRSITFTNRTFIWEEVLSLYKTSPVLGVGEKTFIITNSVINHAHNVYLDVLYKYGTLGFIPFVCMIIYCGKELNRWNKSFIGALSIGTLFIILLHNCFDMMDNYLLIFFLSMFNNVSSLAGIKKPVMSQKEKQETAKKQMVLLTN